MRIPQNFVTVAFLLSLTAAALPAGAAPRFPFEDADVVQRSELIVVGAVKQNSVTQVDCPAENGEAVASEFHATLLVRRVLKGKCDTAEIPITIHYGLTPMHPRSLNRAAKKMEEGGGLCLEDVKDAARRYHYLSDMLADIRVASPQAALPSSERSILAATWGFPIRKMFERLNRKSTSGAISPL